MESTPPPSSHDAPSIGRMLQEAFIFWWRKGLYFNLAVGLTGLSMTLALGIPLPIRDYFGIIQWGIVANLLYAQGYILDSIVIVRSRGKKSLQSARYFLFVTGTLVYILATVLFAFWYWVLRWFTP